MRSRDRIGVACSFRGPSNAVHNKPMGSSGTARTLRRDYTDDNDLIGAHALDTKDAQRDRLYEARLDQDMLVIEGPHASAIHFTLAHAYLTELEPTLTQRFDNALLIEHINSNRATLHTRIRELTRGLGLETVTALLAGHGHKLDWNEPRLYRLAADVISKLSGNPLKVDRELGPNRATCLTYLYFGDLFAESQ